MFLFYIWKMKNQNFKGKVSFQTELTQEICKAVKTILMDLYQNKEHNTKWAHRMNHRNSKIFTDWLEEAAE